ncbi:hypothetical protein JG687_00013533, partial [Phytophthora cactorum]
MAATLCCHFRCSIGVEIGHQLLQHGSDKQRGYWRPRYRWPCKICEPQLPAQLRDRTLGRQ